MEKLPREIAFDIFHRLPPESVVQCKLVCKSWCSLLPNGDDGNYFANMHLLRRRRQRHHHQQQQQGNLDYYYSTLNFIDIHEEEAGIGEFRITEYDQVVEELSCPNVKRLNFSQFCCIMKKDGEKDGKTRVVGSCNGLVCVTKTAAELYLHYDNRIPDECLKDKIGICNPLLHEYVTLPLSKLQFKYNDFKVNCIDIGFGHNPTTDEYKVVRVYRRCDKSRTGDVEVYTLGKSSSNGGAGMWRSKGPINFSWGGRGDPEKTRYWKQSWSPQAVFFNGSIHWLAQTWEGEGLDNISWRNTIVCFDLDDEKFRLIWNSNPDIDSGSLNNDEIVELRGRLCLIEKSNTMDKLVFDPRINGWAIDPNRSSSSSFHRLDIWVLKQDYMNKKEFSWVKEFSNIKWKGVRWGYSPCAIIKKDGDGDEILFWCNDKGLVSYDLKTQNFQEVVGGRQIVPTSMYEAPVLHINSLVSLKALGEEAKENIYEVLGRDFTYYFNGTTR